MGCGYSNMPNSVRNEILEIEHMSYPSYYQDNCKKNINFTFESKNTTVNSKFKT
jgi:hypothetical protein